MSPAKSKKAARKAGKSTKTAAAKSAKRPGGKARKAAKASPAKAAAKPAAASGHAQCAASDPFGDPCQNLPRRPSKYCVIHSYLER